MRQIVAAQVIFHLVLNQIISILMAESKIKAASEENKNKSRKNQSSTTKPEIKSSSKKQITKPALENGSRISPAPAKKAKRVVKSVDKAVKMKKTAANTVEIIFQIRFHTEFGQRLFITGQHDLLGQGDINQALPMEYFDAETWYATIELDIESVPPQGIQYNYLVTESNGIKVFDAGHDKVITRALCSEKQLLIRDSWNHAGYIENAYYTEAFSKVLLKNHIAKVPDQSIESVSHIFRVKTPLLRQSETVCLLGNTPETGNWQENSAIILSRKDDDEYFECNLDLTEVAFPLHYKYGVFDIAQNRFVRYEEGENRILQDVFSKDKITLVNDGWLRLPTGYWKGAGVAIPVFSIRTRHGLGIGEFNDIKYLADWAKKTGIQLIQLLPVNDSTARHSWLDSYPYAAISAFAFHPMYLHVDELVQRSGVTLSFDLDAERKRLNDLSAVDYEAVNQLKWQIIEALYPVLKNEIFETDTYKAYYKANQNWLLPYAAFCYLRDKYKSVDFDQWPAHQQYDEDDVNTLLKSADFDQIAIHFFTQYLLHEQFKEATSYAHQQGIVIKGDIPIGVFRHGSDTWQNPSLYHMDTQAGAPPDDFAVKGQNWGFPTYNWHRMEQDGYAWWRQRFEHMSQYFDAFRIDHILGFFRIWSIPMDAVEGIMGHFEPCIPVHINELYDRNISFDFSRFCRPFITRQILTDMLGDQADYVINTFLIHDGFDHYQLRSEFSTQRLVEQYFSEFEENEHNDFLKRSLFDLISNVILFEAGDENESQYHFRFGMQQTSSFKSLDTHTQTKLNDLYINYFFRRQDDFWQRQALQKLPALKHSTNMLICGEDLGLVPGCVPEVMKQLGMLSLEIQRMPKANDKEFFHPADGPYMSVVTPSTHDMSTIRGWWEEDYQKTQRFYNNELGQWGEAPVYCEDWINKSIIIQHFYSPAMWCVFQMQDILGISAAIRRQNPNEERINVPANPRHYWQYRMHLSVEEIMEQDAFNSEIAAFIKACGRSGF